MLLIDDGTMKNRHTYRKLFALAALLLACAACVEPVKGPVPDRNDDLYPISFRIITQDGEVRTKAGGPLGVQDDYVFDKLFMYCFDANGRYLGRYEATLATKEQKEYTETQNPGEFNGEIPPATARIHFVCGPDRPVGGDYYGMTETEVMNAPGLVYSEAGGRIAYWGYLRRNSAAQLADVFSSSTTELVWMVRDRLWIESKGVFNNSASGFYKEGERDPNNNTMQGPRWVVYGGLNRGYIATKGLPVPKTGYDETADNPFGSYTFDGNNPYQELRHVWSSSPAKFALSSVVTPYPESGGRFTNIGEGDMVPFEPNVQGYQDMYLFDDACADNYTSNTDHVSRIIIKATFKATGNTKFFPICITDGYASEPVQLMRGHRYTLNLETLPEASGYDYFEDAAKAKTFANGALVEIDDKVVEVSDGQFDMRVNYVMKYPLSGETFNSTAVLLHKTTAQDAADATAGSLAVPFYVGKQNSLVGDKVFYFKESNWIDPGDGASNTPAHNASGTVTWGSSRISTDEDKKVTIGENLNTTVTLPLVSVENDKLKESTFNLKGYYIAGAVQNDPNSQQIHHILMRNIDVYTIDQFRIQEAYTKSTQGGDGHNAEGTLELTRNTDGTYSLKFKLPTGSGATGDHDKYPDLLYPLQIKLATKTLQPYNIHYSGQNTSNPVVFGVQVRSTQPGTEPAYLTAPTGQNAASQWNYQETNKYWNFWYTYSITSAPSNPEITIDLKDVRNSSSFSTIPGNVGLFLYIEFFGKASAVSYTQAYVAATGVSLEPTSSDTGAGRISVSKGSTYTELTAKITPATATCKNIKWRSSNPDRATVDANGVVKVTTADVTDGNRDFTITATTIDGGHTATAYFRATN